MLSFYFLRNIDDGKTFLRVAGSSAAQSTGRHILLVSICSSFADIAESALSPKSLTPSLTEMTKVWPFSDLSGLTILRLYGLYTDRQCKVELRGLDGGCWRLQVDVAVGCSAFVLWWLGPVLGGAAGLCARPDCGGLTCLWRSGDGATPLVY